MTQSPSSPTLRRSASHWGAVRIAVEGGRMTEVHPFAPDAEPSEDAPDLLDMLGVEAAAIIRIVEPFQATMAEPPDHCLCIY